MFSGGPKRESLYIKSFEISKFLQMNILIRLRGFQLLIGFLRSIGSVMEGLGLKDGVESIYTRVPSRGYFLPEPAIFAFILSNDIPEDFIAASFQTEDQNRMYEMNETENEAEITMNETENMRQKKVNQQMKAPLIS